MICSSPRFVTPPPRSRRETIEDVRATTGPASNGNRRDVTPPPHNRRNDRSEITPPQIPRTGLNQRDVTPPPRNARSKTTPPPLQRKGFKQNEVWDDFKEATGEDCVKKNFWWYNTAPEGIMSRMEWNAPEEVDPLTSLKKWEATDPASITLFYQILRQMDPAPPMSIYSAHTISGQTLQAKLPEGITASLLRGHLAKMIYFQRFAEDPRTDNVLPNQVRLFVDLMELNYSEPAPLEISMLIDPPAITDPADPWEQVYLMFGQPDALGSVGNSRSCRP